MILSIGRGSIWSVPFLIPLSPSSLIQSTCAVSVGRSSYSPHRGNAKQKGTEERTAGGDRELGEKTSTYHEVQHCVGLRGGSGDGESAHNAGDLGLILGWGRSPGEGNGHPLQCSCLQQSMDRGVWWAAVHGNHKELDMTEQLTHT